LALEDKEQCKLTSDYKDLQGRAEIESGKEGKRIVLRSAKEEVAALCCSEPEAINAIKAFLRPYKALISPKGRPDFFAINGMACSGDSKSTTAEVLSNVVRSKQKGPFTSTNGQYRKFTDKAEVDLKLLVEKHAEDIAVVAKWEALVDSRGDAVLGCVFHSVPTEELSADFAEGRCMRGGLISWIREQSCKDLNRNKGGGGKIPHAVTTCGGSAWFTGGPTEVV
jgi:hypothetical protein